MNRSYVLAALFLSTVAVVLAGWTVWSSAQSMNQVGTQGPSTQAGVLGTCMFTTARFKVHDTGVTTTSSTFVDVTDMRVVFTVSGTTATCLEVEFSALVYTDADAIMTVRALLDGVAVGYPGLVDFVGNLAIEEARAMQFIFTNVAPGSHTVKMQWRSNNSNLLGMFQRSLIVHYR